VSDHTTSFIAVRFDSADDAEAAVPEVRELDVDIRDAAVVVRTEAGRIELQQAHEVAAGEALIGGGSAGLVAGLLLGLPVGGALLGLVGGLAYGLRDRGLPDNRMRQLGADLQPGHALLCVLVDDKDAGEARAALSRYGAVFDVKLAPDPDGGSGSDSGSPSAP
jgi:uncharacterized membrane protein